MKFAVHHHVTVQPFYDLMFDNGVALETWRIQEDLFFDFISGCAVEYKKISHQQRDQILCEGPVNCSEGYIEIADQGEYTKESENRMILNGRKIRGTLVFNPEQCMIETNLD